MQLLFVSNARNEFIISQVRITIVITILSTFRADAMLRHDLTQRAECRANNEKKRLLFINLFLGAGGVNKSKSRFHFIPIRHCFNLNCSSQTSSEK